MSVERQTPAGEIVMFREYMGWTRPELARWLRTRDSRVISWEDGKVQPPVAVTYLLRAIMRYGIYGIGDPVYENEVFRFPVTEEELYDDDDDD